MSRLWRHRAALRCAICVLNVVHLAVHGTALDSGALDGALMQLDLAYVSMGGN